MQIKVKNIIFDSVIQTKQDSMLEILSESKTLYEEIEDIKEKISIKLKKLELIVDDKEYIASYRNKVQELIEKINSQIKDEQANEYRVVPKLFLYNSLYYKNLLDKIIEIIDNDLLRYNFLRKLKIYEIDKVNLEDTINKIISLKEEYEKIKYLFIENDNLDILNVFINKYFDIILLEIENNGNSILFSKLSRLEKQKLQLLLFKKLEEFIKEDKLTIEDKVELSNMEFKVDEFKIYIRLLKEKMASKINIPNKELPFSNNITFSLFNGIKTYIINKYGLKCATSDFAILLGGDVSKEECVSDDRSLKNRTGIWYNCTRSMDGNIIFCVNEYGIANMCVSLKSRLAGIRPTISYSSIKDKVIYIRKNEFNIDEVAFGEYVFNVLTRKEIMELEEAIKNNLVKETGKTYTTDSVYVKDEGTKFKAREHIEYEYKGQKYVRFIGDKNGEGKMLSNGEFVKVDEVYWLKVEPIIWLADEVSDLAISKSILVAGIQYNTSEYKRFEETNIYRYLNNCLIIDIIPSKVSEKDMESKKVLIKKK